MLGVGLSNFPAQLGCDYRSSLSSLDGIRGLTGLAGFMPNNPASLYYQVRTHEPLHGMQPS